MKNIIGKSFIIIFFLFVYQLCTIPFIIDTVIKSKFGYMILTIFGLIIFGLLIYKLWSYFTKDFSFKTNVTKRTYIELSIFIVAIIAASSLDSLFPESGNQKVILDQLHNNLINTVITTVFLAPIVEEIIFRGLFAKLFFPKITDVKTSFWYVLTTSIVFGLAHVQSFDLSIIPYILMGVILALAYIRFGDIKYNIFLHFLNNLISVAMVIL